jgi:putative tryptophan/tyrosine transport system substrate-binding protein
MLDTKRREFIALVGGGGLLLAVKVKRAWGQQPGQVRRIGILMPYPESDTESQTYVRAFRQELARLGWSEGGNVQFDERWSTSNMDSVRADAANLVALHPDVIVVVGDRVIPILTKLTRSIPIVVALTSDPIASGAVESLARPGRNVTGFSLIEFSIFGKMLETLKGLAPGISRVGMMYNPDNPVGAAWRPGTGGGNAAISAASPLITLPCSSFLAIRSCNSPIIAWSCSSGREPMTV